MLKPIQGRETMVHECRQGRGKPEVYLHDVKAYMMIDGKMVDTKYCPYCGVEIESEER